MKPSDFIGESAFYDDAGQMIFGKNSKRNAMKTKATKTSIDCYREYSNRPTLHAKIIGLLIGSFHKSGMCIAEIATMLNLEKSTVSARMNELKKEPFHWEGKTMKLELVNVRPSSLTGIKSEHYTVKPLTNKTLFD